MSFWIGEKLPNYVLSKGRFEMLLHLAQLKHLKKKIGLPEEYQPGQPIPREQLENSIRNTMDLQQLKKEVDLTIDDDGYASLPADFYFPSLITIKNIKDGVKKFRKVSMVSDSVFGEKKGSFIMNPNRYFPIVRFIGGKAEYLPLNLKYSHMTYISIPVKPVYATTYTHGFTEYVQGSSTEMNWDDTNLIDIMVIALGEIGVGVTSGELIQITDKSKQTGQ